MGNIDLFKKSILEEKLKTKNCPRPAIKVDLFGGLSHILQKFLLFKNKEGSK